jgi:transposase
VLGGFGELELVGIEGTGSYGAGLTRHFQTYEIRVVEVDRPNRQRRRRRGKSDTQDAIAAARAAQSGEATGEAKQRAGNVEAMRVLRVERASARKARTQTLNQMRSLICTAPEPIRAELRHLNVYRMLERAAGFLRVPRAWLCPRDLGRSRTLTSSTKLVAHPFVIRAGM